MAMRRVLGLLGLTAALAVLLPGCGGGPKPVVLIETSVGNIKVELNEDEAPLTVRNFPQVRGREAL
jgi:hypothetical protein